MYSKKPWTLGWLLLSALLLAVTGCRSHTDDAETEQGETAVPPQPTLETTTEGDNIPMRTPGKTYEQMVMEDGAVLEYALIIPNNYEASQSYPVLLAFPPGQQSQDMVEAGLGYWETEARKRGWIVVSPVAPNHILFFNGSENYLPAFAERLAAQLSPEGGKFHVGGISNGGVSAFRFAVKNSEWVRSIVVLPGYPLDASETDLANLRDIPVAMFVGENDGGWVSQMQAAKQTLLNLGATVTLEIVPGEGHVIRSLSGQRLFDLLESFR